MFLTVNVFFVSGQPGCAVGRKRQERRKMKDRIFGVLQRVGRSFMLPIAVLPVAGLLLGIGSSFTNATTIQTYGLERILGDKTMLNALLYLLNELHLINF